jgi:hypothetical protein
MKRLALLAVCGAFGLVPRMSGPSRAEAQDKGKDQVKDLLGVWTVVNSEIEGDANASLHNPAGRPFAPEGIRPSGTGGGATAPSAPFVWKIGKEEIQGGWEGADSNFPVLRMQCQWDPGGKVGSVNLLFLDRVSGKKLQAEPEKGIYLLKDDVLIICHGLGNGPRPERFTTAADSKSVLLILRRGK